VERLMEIKKHQLRYTNNILWLIETIEKQQKEIIESKERELSYIDDIEQMGGMIQQANELIRKLEENARNLSETVFTLNMNKERLLEQNKKFRQRIFELRKQNSDKVYKENLKLLHEIEQIKGGASIGNQGR
jgi:nucleoside-triphosphatase THEP1